MHTMITTLVLLFTSAAFSLPRENTHWNGFNILKSTSAENTCDFSIESVVSTDGREYKRIRQGQFQVTSNGMVFDEILEHAIFQGSLVIDRSAGKLVYKGLFSYDIPQSRLNGAPARVKFETVGRSITHVFIERQTATGEFVFSNGCGSMKMKVQKSLEQ